jgi:cation:H+ antiporter
LALIILAGTRLSGYGDIIAEKSGLGHIWVGIVLLATVTSLPEVATGMSSVAIVKSPDLAVGDLFGSSLINLAIIALMDILYTKGPILRYLGTGVVLATILSILLISASAVSIFLAHSVVSMNLLGIVGIYSPVLFGLYLVSQYMLFRFRTQQPEEARNDSDNTTDYTGVSLKGTLIKFSLTAVVIVGAGIWLGLIGDQISETTGLKANFVGTLFLAISTSAPEIVVSIASVRIGSPEMAVANVVGSNLFNIGIVVFLDDLVFGGGPLLASVSMGHILTALFALMMSSVVIIGIVFRPKIWLKSWVGIDTTFIALLYIAALVALYFYG